MVIELAKLRGWDQITHFRSAMNRRGRWETPLQGNPGWPDLFMCRSRTGQVLAPELKAEKGRLSVEQENWLAALRSCGITAPVWRPGNWPEIERMLEIGPPSKLDALRDAYRHYQKCQHWGHSVFIKETGRTGKSPWAELMEAIELAIGE